MATEQQIREWQAHTELFIDTLNRYIEKRKNLDPTFKAYELDLMDLDEDVTFDIFGDDITIQWREYDRCDEYNYFSTTFPLSHLWSIDWEQEQQRWAEQRRLKEEAEAARKAYAEARMTALRAQQLERHERSELARLQSKYGTV